MANGQLFNVTPLLDKQCLVLHNHSGDTSLSVHLSTMIKRRLNEVQKLKFRLYKIRSITTLTVLDELLHQAMIP